MSENLKLYACTDHHGVYLSGVSIVLAANEDQAREFLAFELRNVGLDWSGFSLRELPIQPGAVILWDGDY